MEHAPRIARPEPARKPAADQGSSSFARDLRPEAAQRRAVMQAMREGAAIQRQTALEEEPLQGKFGVIQRAGAAPEDELQMKRGAVASAGLQLKSDPSPAPNNTGLPNTLKAGVESLSGLSMDGVKVHYNSSEPARLGALAYAQGTDIHLGPGQEQHLPHEAWHVVQQAEGRVRPTTQMKVGVSINDDASLEHEADQMGARALQATESDGADHADGSIPV